MTLEQWGFRSDFAHPLDAGEVYARVLEEQKSSYLVVTELGELTAQLPGRLLHASIGRLERPVVGDWLVVRPLPNENKAVVQLIVPRKALLRRRAAGETEAVQPLAANVELAVVVTSLNKEFNEKRLHRYLTVVQESGSAAAIVLTKKDLSPESEGMAATLGAKYNVPCLAVSALSGEGIAETLALLKQGETSVFVGSSGVGKSTLVNLLLGRQEQVTAEIRGDDDRGRHTTTSRRLIFLPNGALVIDTPGMREIQLESGHQEGLSLGFSQIETLALQCKFHNCAHESEPGCAVKAALESGTVGAFDYESYLKLKRETAFQERKKDKGLAAEEKKRWKKVAQGSRENNKQKGKS